MFPITSFFAGLLALYYVRLAIGVIRLRKQNQVSLGSGGYSDLEAAIRAHGNFAEYVPFGLLLLGLLESHSSHPVLLVVMGCMLCVGRFAHAQGLTVSKLKLRVLGMSLTFGALITLAVINLVYGIKAWWA